MKGPAITLRCDCGSEGRAAYGESWACPTCGRTYDTTRIPVGDYGEIASLDRRYKRASWAIVSVLAVMVLMAALTRQMIPTFAGLALVLLTWFLWIKPIVHKRHKRAVSGLTRHWNLEAEGGSDA